MERIEDLIHKLVTQQAEGVPASELLVTVQEMYAVLAGQQPQPTVPSSGKVAVIMPAGLAYHPVVKERRTEKPDDVVTIKANEEFPALPKEVEATVVEEAAPAQPYALRKPEDSKQAEHQSVAAPANPSYDILDDVPTLRQQAPAQLELHELLGTKEASLNDKLKLESPELAQALKHEPIKDLRKGIGVNDKFLFINELFRGDEAMYERSIKTINAFHILPEAEYWINRELKVKLGWNDTAETVQHFYAVVRRRFS